MNEQIIGVYADGNYKINDALIFKGGLRYEHTRFDLDMNGLSPNILRDYGNLFPSALVSYRLNDNHSFSVYYNKRINRPTFNDMRLLYCISIPILCLPVIRYSAFYHK